MYHLVDNDSFVASEGQGRYDLMNNYI